MTGRKQAGKDAFSSVGVGEAQTCGEREQKRRGSSRRRRRRRSNKAWFEPMPLALYIV